MYIWTLNLSILDLKKVKIRHPNQLISSEIAYKLIGRDRETGYPLVDLIQIKRNKTILKIRYVFFFFLSFSQNVDFGDSDLGSVSTFCLARLVKITRKSKLPK